MRVFLPRNCFRLSGIWKTRIYVHIRYSSTHTHLHFLFRFSYKVLAVIIAIQLTFFSFSLLLPIFLSCSLIHTISVYRLSSSLFAITYYIAYASYIVIQVYTLDAVIKEFFNVNGSRSRKKGEEVKVIYSHTLLVWYICYLQFDSNCFCCCCCCSPTIRFGGWILV